MRFSVKKKHIVALFLVLIPLWMIGVSNFLFSAPSFTHEISFDRSNAVNIFPYDVIEIIGYEHDGNRFFTNYEDSQIHFSPPSHKVASGMIVLETPLQRNHRATIYYTIGNEDFGGANVVIGRWPAGDSELIFNLPEAYFSSLRFDIDIIDEPFALQGIYLSQSPLLMSRQWVGNLDGILMTLILSTIVAALWVAGLYTGYLDSAIKRLIDGTLSKIRFIKENPQKSLLHAGTLLSIMVIALIVQIAFPNNVPLLSITGISRVLFFAIAGASLYCIVVFRRKPEKLFLSLSLIIGLLYVAVSPLFWYAFDQTIHYAWAVEESFVRVASVSQSDWFLSNNGLYGFSALLTDPGSAPGLRGAGDLVAGHENPILFSFIRGTDTLAELGPPGRYLISRFAHIPTGFFIFIGRSLALAPILIVKLGMLGNHIIYTLIVYFAIKRINSGKHIMAVIAMFPTSFVLSTTYGYDHWLIALSMLGFAHFFNEMQNPEKKIKPKIAVLMVGAFFIGIGPKAIYFPLMCILYFMKKSKFKTKKGYYSYLAGVTCGILLILSSFLVPFLAAGGGGIGDIRGGADVNASAQTMFILNNPLEYTGILLRFMWQYINIFTTQDYVTFFAHLGSSSFFILVWMLMGFVILTDRNKMDALTSTAGYKGITSLMSFSTIALFSTALYVAFTPVGADHIAGLQGRYILPVLFPFLYVVGSLKIMRKVNSTARSSLVSGLKVTDDNIKTAYSSVVFGIMSFVLLAGAWEMFITR